MQKTSRPTKYESREFSTHKICIIILEILFMNREEKESFNPLAKGF